MKDSVSEGGLKSVMSDARLILTVQRLFTQHNYNKADSSSTKIQSWLLLRKQKLFIERLIYLQN